MRHLAHRSHDGLLVATLEEFHRPQRSFGVTEEKLELLAGGRRCIATRPLHFGQHMPGLEQLVEGDGRRLGQIHRAMILGCRNRDDPMTAIEVSIGQTIVFPAENNGHFLRLAESY